MTGEGRFYTAFLECMLWSTCYDGDPKDAEFMDEVYSFEDIEQQSADMLKDLCQEFIAKVGWDAINEHNAGQAGHDFWLTIAGHGSGFWDGDWPENGDMLAETCEAWINDVHCYSDGEEVYCDASILTTETIKE